MSGEPVSWPNVDLGDMPNEKFATRILRLLRAIPRLIAHRKALTDAEIIIARNLDMLALAWIARVLLSGGETKLVYESLDIHGLLTRTDRVGRLMRSAERFFLKRIDLLWTSSPGFLRNFFVPVQGYDGPHFVIENKLWFENVPARPREIDRVTVEDRFTLGWVGSIRCAASLEVLAGVADRLGRSIEIAVHGTVHHHAVPDFEGVLRRHERMTYHGPYAYPDDLASIYLGCDAVWAQYLWQRGGNSDWLLPNRIYEAGWFGCPCIAVADTETGRRIVRDGLGFVVDQATPEALVALLNKQPRSAFGEVSKRLLSMPEERFRLDVSDITAALQAIPGKADEIVGNGQQDSVANP